MASTTSPDRRRLPRPLRATAVAAFWLLLWQAAAMATSSDLLLVSPVEVVLRLAELLPSPAFWARVGHSFGRILAGFGLGVLAGLLLAIASGMWRMVADLLSPVIRAMRSIPVFSFIILVLIWFDSARLAAVVSFLMVMPIVYSDVLEGIGQVDQRLRDLARVFGVPRHRRWLAVDIPAVWPYLTTACRVGVGLAWKSGISAEVIGLPTGSIGERLYQAKIFLSTGDLFAWTLAVLALSYLFEKLVLLALRRGEVRLRTVFSTS